MIINQVVKGSGGSSGDLAKQYGVDGNGKIQAPTSFMSLGTATDVDDYGLMGAYSYWNGPTNVTADMSQLTAISGYSGCQQMFSYSSAVSSVDLRNVVTLGTNACSMLCYESNVSSFRFDSLTTIGSSGLESAFAYCYGVRSVSFPALTTIDSNGMSNSFAYCYYVPSVTFTSLTSVGSRALADCFCGCAEGFVLSFPALTSSSFPAGVDNCFSNMLGETDMAVVHFPSNLQAVIGDWDDVINGFDGSDTTVLFDLPATE